ncbi:MAG: DNA gyrase subunit A [Candidatus Aminicenantes bacterium]|nr:DNA gyrase subunit A [Candidatus Aminicenantes bacterium]
MSIKTSVVSLEEEMKSAYLDYAMSVIIGRAIPDVKDGLKPVHRRTLFAMHEAGNTWNRPYKKSARIVGDVIGKFHPHGDTAVYDTLVRMAQDFSLRFPLVDGQGNFGSIDGDPPAAMRYTEVRMKKLTQELLADLEKDTVNFVPNYDESLQMPEVFPAKFPNLLVNGGSGIAVGMATNIPPHNLGEVIDGTIHLIQNPDATVEKIMEFVPGPDFPTGAYIFGQDGIKNAYKTGRGTIKLRARALIERGRNNERDRIVVTEIPYQVNKARLLENIAALVNGKKLEGIADIRDESDREGMRAVIEVKRGELPEVVLNNLYKHTQLQTSFGIIMLAIVEKQPKVLGLLDAMRYFISHRQDVVRRRTRFELKKAEERAHILEGLTIALDNLDEIITLIRGSRTVEEARKGLILKFHLTQIQAQAILDMQLQKLTGLEREKIQTEYQDLQKLIKMLRKILGSDKMILDIIVDELKQIKDSYQNERKSELVMEDINVLELEDLIKEEDVAVTYTSSGYIKRTSLSYYKFQIRGGKGRRGISMKTEDIVQDLFICSTHSYMLFLTNKGHLYWLKTLYIPDVGVSSRGKSIKNLLELAPDEKVSSVVAVKEFAEDQYIVMLCSDGRIKKSKLSDYKNIRKGGIIAISLGKKTELIQAKLTDGTKDILIGTKLGKAVKFSEKDVRPMGRTAAGVRGITLGPKDEIIGMVITEDEEDFVFTASSMGFGKKTKIDFYPKHRRGGKGVVNLKLSKKIGNAIGMISIADQEILLITQVGKIIRIKTEKVRPLGRATQGVKIINLEKDDRVVSLAKVRVS